MRTTLKGSLYPRVTVIISGGSLRHVPDEVKKTRPTLDTRDELLGQIRTGVQLRKVDLDSLSSGADEAPPSGIAGMLQKALKERETALCLSSDSDDDGEDDDEWDD